MKIIVATVGSRGDVQPYINLCQGLIAAGHKAILATNPTLCGLAEAHGVRTAPVGQPVDMGAEGARLMAGSFDNMWISMIKVMQLGARLVEEAYPDVLRLLKGADLVVTSDSTCGIAEAEKLGVPWISVTLQPGRIPLPAAKAGIFQRAAMAQLTRLFVLPTNRFRRRVGAPVVKDLSDMLSRRLVLLPVSPHVAQPDPRWPAQVYPTGYWFARPQSGWTPPQDLVDFLAAGEKPVAVSLGVMSKSGKQAREGAQVVLKALREANVRAVLQGWDEALEGIDLPATVYHAGSLPHAWLFDQVSAVIHHGGFGTTASTLRSGAPGIIVPHIIDQFYWGQRVAELGVGPKPIPRGKLSVDALRQAITLATQDADMRQRAARLGEQIRAEPDGIECAVQRIEMDHKGI